MKKALLVAHIGGFIPRFEYRNVRYLQSLGYEVHCASNFTEELYPMQKQKAEELGMILHDIPFTRSPFTASMLSQYKLLKKLMETEKFELVHCHTPTAGVFARLAAHATHTAPVIYTAHGFHFYKGAPFVNKLLFYPIEKYCSKYTDLLITINDEDYELAKKKLHAKKTIRVHGVGIDRREVSDMQVDAAAEELGIKAGTKVLLSVGEIQKNKNQTAVIEALAKMSYKNYVYLIAGIGEDEEKIKQLAQKSGIADRVKLLGYRNDIPVIGKLADIFVFPSLREGLSVALMEAMSSGCAVVCSDIRGNRELIDEGRGGFRVEPSDTDAIAQKLDLLCGDDALCKSMADYNTVKVNGFTAEVVGEEMKRAYGEVIR